MSNIYERIESWRDKLLDVGNRNPLINCSFSESRGAIEVVTDDCESLWRQLCADSEAGSVAMMFPWRRDLVPPPEDHQSTDDVGEDGVNGDKKPKDWNPPLEKCRASSLLEPGDLLTKLTDKVLDRRLRTLQGYGRLAMSEQGVHAVFAVFGFLKWVEKKAIDGGGTVRYSPLVLVPVTLERSSSGSPWEILEAEDDAYGNLCLKQRLLQDFQVQLPDLPPIDQLEESGARLEYLDAVRDAIRNEDDWEVEDRCVVGRFAFPKIAMWEDLGVHKDELADHPIPGIVAEDPSVNVETAFGPVTECTRAKDLDDTYRPGEIKTILDCDSSQLEAIAAARKGISFVLDGPPGTGKSQTIANIIAETLAVGRTVLFVSEKSAALDVVQRRLDEKGLGDFCLECHSSKANRKAVLYELEQCLDLPAETYPPNAAQLHELHSLRESLNTYVRHLHAPVAPLGMSAFDVFGRISRLQKNDHEGYSQCQLPDATSQTEQTILGWENLLNHAIEHAELLSDYDSHPWRDCLLTTRPLSFTEDLRQHAETFCRTAEAIVSATRPLVDRELLADVTRQNIKSTQANIAAAASAPAVEPRWFESPRDYAKTILELAQLEQDEVSLREALSNYSDDAYERFNRQELEAAAADSGTVSAFVSRIAEGRLFVSDSDSVRRTSGLLAARTRLLDEIRSHAGGVSENLSELLRQTKLPVKASQPLKAMPFISKVLKTLIAMAPLRASWFRQSSAAAVIAAAEGSLRDLRKIEKLSGQRSDNWLGLGAKALALSRGGGKVMQAVAEFTGRTSSSELGELHENYSTLSSAVRLARVTTGPLFEAIGLTDLKPNMATAQCIAALFSDLESPELIHPTWSDGGVLSKLIRQLPEVVEELEEAEEIRNNLSDRLSLRAFRTEAAVVAGQAEGFSSMFGRLGKRYSQFKSAAADFYRSELPGRDQLLADCRRLATFHRRSDSAAKLLEELSTHLLESCNTSSVDNLKRVLNATKSLATAFEKVSETTGQPRRQDQPINGPALVESSRETLQALQSIPEPPEGIANGSLQDLETTCLQRTGAIENCLGFLQAAETCYEGNSPSAETIVTDVQRTEDIDALMGGIRKRATEIGDGLPDGFDDCAADEWLKLGKAVKQAQQIATALRLKEPSIDRMCSVEASAYEEADTQLAALLGHHQKLVELLEGHSNELAAVFETPVNELGAEELHGLAAKNHEEIGCTSQAVDAHISLLQSTTDVAVGDIETNQRQLRRLGQIVASKAQCLAETGHLQLGSHSPDEVLKATWLEQMLSSDQLTPLVQAAAMDHEIRQIVQEAHAAFAHSEELERADAFIVSLFPTEHVIDRSSSLKIQSAPLNSVVNWTNALQSRAAEIDDYLRFNRWRDELGVHKLGGVAEELIARRYASEAAADLVMLRIYRSLGDHLISSDSVLSRFDLDDHERLRQKFESLDQWEIKAAATAIREYQLGRSDRPRGGFEGSANSELGILQKEFSKKRKHMPLRRLFSEIADILLKLKPCIMMSPLSVSTFLQDERLRFDLVVFDEASQVFPWDAMGAIYRGKQLIVAGDEKQLPPTNFFQRAEVESDDDDDIADYESILSVCKANNMPSIRLRWHYRSRREVLIAFSNRHFYNGDLVTFPSSRDAANDGVRLELVEDGRWIDRKNLPEAHRVVDLIIEHMRKRPDKSLGVIAFSQSQRQAIDDELYDRRRKDPVLDKLFNNHHDEALFVKNLERVQGDERDVIMLSIGYARNVDNKIPARFGPINASGGERRLNVAVTRAREQMIVISSVRAADLDLSGSKSEGAHLMKAYLQYAETGTDSLGVLSSSIGDETESPFEADVATALVRRGFEPVPQVGCGGFRIDLALKHPQRPGEFCLGIECDGATYHSSYTARDRDRIRQTMLENLGWKIVRVWSTDWVKDPERQLQRIERAYEAAVADSPDTPIETPNETPDVFADTLTPTLTLTQESTTNFSFDNINEVPESTIEAMATYILQRSGPCPKEDLIKSISRNLGFRRLGPRIRQRLSVSVDVLVVDEKLHEAGGRIVLKNA